MAPSGNPFSAADAALGYLYQIRIALLWSLKKQKATPPELVVSVETLDDVTFELLGGTPEQLLQTKLHLKSAAELTDYSVDIWKTLRVWFEGHSTNAIPPGTSLQLLTTASAAPGSAASLLRVADRDVDAALTKLSTAATLSENAQLAPAFQAFFSATEEKRKEILDCVVVMDAYPAISNLDDQLRDEVFWGVDRGHHDAFLIRLEGWWLRRVLKQLTDPTGADRILGAELEAEMDDLRQQFKQDSLPIDDDLLTFRLDAEKTNAHAQSTFVRQLELVRATKKRIAMAIRDYYRAFEQRSRWVREDLLLVGDLDKYEERLIEEWSLVFEAMKNEIGADAASEAKEKAAREVLEWAERNIIPIRHGVIEPFVSRGSFHILAEGLRVGWHPDFLDHLTDLLQPSKETSP